MDIQKIRQQLQVDAVLLFAAEEILASSGIYAPKSCLIADERGQTLIAPEGQEISTDVRLLEYAEFGFEHVEDVNANLWKRIKDVLQGKKRIGLNKYSCPMALLEEKASTCEFVDVSKVLSQLMMCKTPAFFQKYAEIKNLNVKAYDSIKREIHSGCTERELYDLVKKEYVTNTDGQALYTGDFLSGDRTLLISGSATDRVIMPGDTVIVDALCASGGVFCDTTRSYICGEPTKEQERLYGVLRAVQSEAAKMLRPGTVAGDIYRYVNRRLKEEGYPGLVHHAGHGLGLKWYEAPYFIEECDIVLQEDMLVALEPGVYIPDQFGLRIENNYRVTEHGGVDVFDYKIELEDFIID